MTSNKILSKNKKSSHKKSAIVATSEAVAEAVAVASATADASLSVDYGMLRAVSDEAVILDDSENKADTDKLQAELKRILCKKLHPSKRENNGVLKCCTVPKSDKPRWWASRRLDASCKNILTIWHEDYYCHCKSVWVCPRCSPIKGLDRRFIIRSLIYTAKKEDDKECYLLTLTTRHDSTMALNETLDKLEDASKRFWADWKIKEIRKQSFVGRVTALEIMYGGHGWHPHFHVLLIGEKGLDLKELGKTFSDKWLDMLHKVGLDGLEGIACDLEACKDIKDYLTKIPCEICGVSKKDGKFPKHLNFFGLLSKCQQTPNGQRKRKLESLVFEYYEATKSRQFIHFSKELKKMYGVEDESEDAYMDRIMGLGDWQHVGLGYTFDEGYENLTREEVTKCLRSLSGYDDGDEDFDVHAFLKEKGVTWHHENASQAKGFTGDEATDAFLRYIRASHKSRRKETRIYNPDALAKKKKQLDSEKG